MRLVIDVHCVILPKIFSVLRCMVQGALSCLFPTPLRELRISCTAEEYKRAQIQTPLSVPVLLPQNLNTLIIISLKE
jgi:hypothetical protein